MTRRAHRADTDHTDTEAEAHGVALRTEPTAEADGAPLGTEPTAFTAGPAYRPYWQVPVPCSQDRIVGGIAAGIAREIGVEPIWIRLAFVMLLASGGWGALAYAAAWALGSWADATGNGPSAPPVPKGRDSVTRHLGLALVVLGLVAASAAVSGWNQRYVWASGLLSLGGLIVRRQVAGSSSTSREGPRGYMLLLGGLAAIGAGAVILTISLGAGTQTTVPLGAFLVLLALAALTSPLWWRLIRNLDRERQARTRSEERTAVAAHLHDSVLQTLALIQNTDDPRRMRALARRQERELRNWLDPDRVSRTGGGIRGRLDRLASDIEELYGLEVRVVVVGDGVVDAGVEAALGATREAVVNSAKHSGVDGVDVYAEVGAERLDVFIRDRGRGFEPDLVAGDRRGIRHSIEGRVLGAGGRVRIRSSKGEGTEIEITVPLNTSGPGASAGTGGRVAASTGPTAAGDGRIMEVDGEEPG